MQSTGVVWWTAPRSVTFYTVRKYIGCSVALHPLLPIFTISSISSESDSVLLLHSVFHFPPLWAVLRLWTNNGAEWQLRDGWGIHHESPVFEPYVICVCWGTGHSSSRKLRAGVAKFVPVIHTLLYVVNWRVGEGTLLATPIRNLRDTDGPTGVSLSIGYFLN
jgi:hypothetical protein